MGQSLQNSKIIRSLASDANQMMNQREDEISAISYKQCSRHVSTMHYFQGSHRGIHWASKKGERKKQEGKRWVFRKETQQRSHKGKSKGEGHEVDRERSQLSRERKREVSRREKTGTGGLTVYLGKGKHFGRLHNSHSLFVHATRFCLDCNLPSSQDELRLT